MVDADLTEVPRAWDYRSVLLELAQQVSLALLLRSEFPVQVQFYPSIDGIGVQLKRERRGVHSQLVQHHRLRD